jgi:hypothetical protein
MFGPKRDKISGEWRKLHTEELHTFCSFLSIIRQIQSWRMRWAGHVAGIGEDKRTHGKETTMKTEA